MSWTDIPGDTDAPTPSCRILGLDLFWTVSAPQFAYVTELGQSRAIRTFQADALLTCNDDHELYPLL